MIKKEDMKKILSIIMIFAVWTAAFADEFSRGQKAFEDGNYKTATEVFLKELEKSPESAALMFDLGTSYTLDGNLGLGRLFMERAYRLDPRNNAIKTNLAYISSRVDDANRASMTGKRGSVEPDPRGFIGEFNHKVSAEFTSNYWATFAVISFILFLGAVALYLFPQNVAARKVGFFGAILFLIFSGVFIGFSVMAANQARSQEYGVITAYKYALLEEPDSKAKPSSSELNQGSKVRILSEESDLDGNVAWYKVRLNSNYLGWIPASDLEVI